MTRPPRDLSGSSGRAFVRADAGRTLLLAGLAAVSALPPRTWSPICLAANRLTARLRPSSTATYANYLAASAGHQVSYEPAETAVRVKAIQWLEMVHFLAEQGPLPWEPAVRVSGLRHVREGLAGGHGVILWVAHMGSSDLVAKVALDRAGFRVSHLSRPQHGFGASESAFSVRVLNPVKTVVERRYLRERLVMSSNPTGALRRLRELLQANEVVSITAWNNASTTVCVPFLDHTLQLATGPVDLARSSGAPLLPVFTVQAGPSSFDVRIAAPLPVGRTRGTEGARPAAECFARLAESYARRDPAAWHGFANGMMHTEDSPALRAKYETPGPKS